MTFFVLSPKIGRRKCLLLWGGFRPPKTAMEALAAEIATLREQAEIEKRAREELQEQVKKLQEEVANKGKHEEDKRAKLAAATSEIVAAVLKINQVYDPLNNPE